MMGMEKCLFSKHNKCLHFFIDKMFTVSYVGCMSSCHSTVTTSRRASVDDMSLSSSEELITATQDSLHDALGLESSASMIGVS